MEGLNHALGYIEDHLDESIDVSEVARAACCSAYHFQRLFTAVTDVTPSEYIRRRRLTLAAIELQRSDARVIDIAVQYGYTSADAFTRAFTALHGVTPSKARAPGTSLKAYPRMTIALTIKGVVAMNYRIEDRPAFRVVGVKERFPADIEVSFRELPKMWARCNSDGTSQAIWQLQDGQPCGCLGICADMSDNRFDYWIAVATSKECPPGLSEMVIPASTWAIFEVTGAMPKALQDVNRRIYAEWFPASGYTHAPTPDFELYFEGDTASPDYKSEIWMPIVKK